MADLTTIGQSKSFAYTGNVQSINLLAGIYKLECWGARGGYSGGLGGYSIGYYILENPSNLYIVVGGQGANNSGATYGTGGYNGGGRGGNSSGGYTAGAGGGGATHIATTNRGVLANYSSYRNEVLIVAGGGGGAGSWYGSGNGYGGGLSGNNVSARNGAVVQGGTQTTGYAFGQGQPGGNANGGSAGSEGNGGGGGGWYGGYAYQGTGNNSNCVGAGGSGYIGGVSSSINLNGTVYTSSTTGNNRSGHGYATITLLQFTSALANVFDYLQNLSLDSYTILNQGEIEYHYNNFVPNTHQGFTYDRHDVLFEDNICKVNCYYTRNSYVLTLNNGKSKKYSYLYEEEGNLEYIRNAFNDYLLKFKNWKSNDPVHIDLPYLKQTTFQMPAQDITIYAESLPQDRVNTNIYKNIFESLLFDLYNVQDILKGVYNKTTTIFQYNHQLSLYDLVYFDNNGLYKKGLANEEKYNVIGIVSEIINTNEFVLMTYGQIETDYVFNSDSGILYLSDIEPGKFCVHEDITTTFYTPIGFYTGNTITIHILDSSVGDVLKKYQEKIYNDSFTYLTEIEKQNIIQEVLNNA